MTDPQIPATEAGRRLCALDSHWHGDLAQLAAAIIAIEAEARASPDVDVLARAIVNHAWTHKTHSRSHVSGTCAKAVAATYRAILAEQKP